MPVLEVTVQAVLDGVPLAGFPIVKRLAATFLESRVEQRANGAGYTPFTDDIASVVAAIMQTDQPISIKLSGGPNVDLVLNAGGLLLMLDVLINSGATTNIEYENTSGNTATVRGSVFGV